MAKKPETMGGVISTAIATWAIGLPLALFFIIKGLDVLIWALGWLSQF